MLSWLYPIAATISGFGLIPGLWLYWHKDAPRITTFLFLCAGVLLGGWLGSLVGSALSLALGQTASLGSRMIGVGAGLITGIAVVAVIEVVVQGILPFKKLKGKPKRWHPWAALVLPALISAAGAPALSLGLISQPAIAFVIGMYLFWKKLMPRITTLLWLVGGFLVSGALGSAAAATVTALVNQLGTTGARFTGFSAAAILAGLAIALTAEVLIKGASPFKKTFKANPKRYHPPLALALPTVVAASGLPVVTEVLRSISSVVI